MMNWTINLAGLLLAAGTVWWFWFAGRKNAVTVNDGRIEIRVAQGAYSPDRVAIPAGEAVTFEFTRDDPAPCAGLVQFEGLSVSRELPVGEPVSLSIQYEQPGDYEFTCQMGMYRGHVIVK